MAAIRTLHRHAHRLLRPVQVLNPLVDSLKFVSDRLRNRRDHAKYLSLIQAIALLHQHQREIHTEEDGTEWIEVQESEYALANRLMDKLLKQSLSELAPQTEQVFALGARVCGERLPGRGSSSSGTGYSSATVPVYSTLVSRKSVGGATTKCAPTWTDWSRLEHLIVHRGKQGATYVYQLAD